MYRIVQRILLLFLILSIGLFSLGTYRTRMLRDSYGPGISMEEESVTISVNDGEESILRGVRAQDAKDGDVTESLVVQELSNFVEKGWRIATIAAFDSDNNVSKLTRNIRYSDYVSPRFSVAKPLIFTAGARESDIVSAVRAQDCLDGDVSGDITVELEDPNGWMDTAMEGAFRLVYTVVNSAGDVAELPATVQFCEYQTLRATRLKLSENLVYLQRGAAFDPLSYAVGMEKNDEAIPLDWSLVRITNPVDTSVPGAYEVKFTVDEGVDGIVTASYLLVLVE